MPTGPLLFQIFATCDAYVVLGSRALENVPDIDGKGDSWALLHCQGLSTAYRLYKIDPKPIIISSGKIFNRGQRRKLQKDSLFHSVSPETIL